MTITFEALGDAHRKPVIDIFNHYVTTTTAAYRAEAVDYAFFDGFCDPDDVLASYAIVASPGGVVGFCTLEPFKGLASFAGNAETMYFLSKDWVGKGIGGETLAFLEGEARGRGVTKLLVDITDDNEASLAFHRKHGFREYGHLENCWQKFEKPLGIVYMEKNI